MYIFKPVRAYVWIMPVRLSELILCSHSDKSTFKLIVKTEVKRGYAGVVGAKVEVQAGSLPWKQMRDDGIGGFHFIRFG